MMAKRSLNGRKLSGAAAIESVDDVDTADRDTETMVEVAEVAEPKKSKAKAPAQPKSTAPAKADASGAGQVGVGEIRKAAAFANSIGGLDKAIALLQILKVAKEVQ